MCVIDMASHRRQPTAPTFLCHPAGVRLPLDHASDADLVPPEVRRAIESGAYSSDLIRLLPDIVRAGDRVLVIGAGLGVVSTLIAKGRVAQRVVALEANMAVLPYLQRAHALNGVPWVETVNGVAAVGARGRVPFFARRDFRTSSVLAEEGDWQQVMLVPLVDLDLILAEEAISLIVCETPMSSAHVLGESDLGGVERVVIAPSRPDAEAFRADELATLLTRKGFASAEAGRTIVLDRDGRLPGMSAGNPRAGNGTSAT